MKTFVLFIFGAFEDHEDVEFFCTEVLSELGTIKKLRYVIENSMNLIVIFDSDSEYSKLIHDIYNLIGTNENIKLYFLFDRDTIITAHLPEKVKDFMFKPIEEDGLMMIEIRKSNTSDTMDLDDVLDKIEKMGLDSLTPEEKNFLDNFDK